MSKAAVFCIATSQGQADRIAKHLKIASFPSDIVSTLFPDRGSRNETASGRNLMGGEWSIAHPGMVGLAGGALAWIDGIGAMDVPGVGPFIAAGPIVAAVTSAGLGVLFGRIAGGLINLGVPVLEARGYEGKIREGNILISVHSGNPGEIDRARDIFLKNGAHDIRASGEEAASDEHRTAEPVRHGRLDDYQFP